MNRAAMRLALQRIEEARGDNWSLYGSREFQLPSWMTHLSERVGLVAHQVIRYTEKSHLDGKDCLNRIAYELAETAALCVEMMEYIDAEYDRLDGPRIREFQQVAIGEDRANSGVNTAQEPETS